MNWRKQCSFVNIIGFNIATPGSRKHATCRQSWFPARHVTTRSSGAGQSASTFDHTAALIGRPSPARVSTSFLLAQPSTIQQRSLDDRRQPVWVLGCYWPSLLPCSSAHWTTVASPCEYLVAIGPALDHTAALIGWSSPARVSTWLLLAWSNTVDPSCGIFKTREKI